MNTTRYEDPSRMGGVFLYPIYIKLLVIKYMRECPERKETDMDALQAAEQIEQAARKDAKGSDHIGTSMRQMLSAGVSDEVLLMGMSIAGGYLPKPTV